MDGALNDNDGIADILKQIIAERTCRVLRDGAAQGLNLPTSREVPLVDFIYPAHSADGILIAEIKRRSPSKGHIAAISEPAALAKHYADTGFNRISVLTEENRFGGSLADLMAVKKAHPHLALLRKDFLLTLEDVEVSYRAGADAILLIAAILDADTLKAMYERAGKLGLVCLIEVHSKEDVDKARTLSPPLVGINSRNLRRFSVEPLLPLEIRGLIDWPCHVIYESGITRHEDALFVRGTGFDGFLAGEALARDPQLAVELIRAWSLQDEAIRRYGAWKRLYTRYKPGKPMVKICGLTSEEDAQASVAAGADLLGFVLADSPRRVTPNFIRGCAGLSIPKVAVVTLKAGEKPSKALIDLLADEVIDFIQFHGDETPDTVRAWPSYKALSLQIPEDVEFIDQAGSPAVLVDTFSPTHRGGSGMQMDAKLVRAAAGKRRLWLAGGLSPENIAGIVRQFQPALVDVSSGVAIADGIKRRKDHEKIARFISAIREVESV